MSANKRTKWDRENDYAEIARLYLSGKLQRDISKILSEERDYTLTQQQISHDLGIIRKRWRDSSLRDFDDLKAQELAKVDQLEVTYWDAWERSTGDRQRRKTARVQGEKQTDRAEVLTEEQVGDHRFLQGVQWCIERRCRILGLDAPTKFAPTDPSGRKSLMLTEEEREERLKKLLQQVSERAATDKQQE